MVRTLYLIRHAEAVSAFQSSSDYERTLTDNGIMAARQLGAALKASGFVPDLILSSAAVRAHQTAENITEAADYLSGISLDQDLYEASLRVMLSKINQISADVRHVIVIGHNPTISFFAEFLLDDLVGNISPCQMVKIAFGADQWQHVTKGSGYLIDS